MKFFVCFAGAGGLSEQKNGIDFLQFAGLNVRFLWPKKHDRMLQRYIRRFYITIFLRIIGFRKCFITFCSLKSFLLMHFSPHLVVLNVANRNNGLDDPEAVQDLSKDAKKRDIFTLS